MDERLGFPSSIRVEGRLWYFSTLGTILAGTGVLFCGHGLALRLNLDDLCRHNVIEHDASMVHRDVAETGGGSIASNKSDSDLMKKMIETSDGQNLTFENLILIKALREQQAGIDRAVHSYPIGLGVASHADAVLASEVMSRPGGQGIPIEWAKTWFGEERLPDEFKKHKTLGILELNGKREEVTAKVNALHSEHAAARRND
ncbi:hypothetical protein FRC17_005429 [Serendipita sp. 399]|nr:hypothetical protein FRC17_005429 [Serendipita sp. 399]